eukprot:scaffold443_cov177-Amphora_coffeaeformis.AAC.12
MRRLFATSVHFWAPTLLTLLLPTGAVAFQNELFQQALQAVNAVNSLDQLIFAAANLLDTAAQPRTTTEALYYNAKQTPPRPQFQLQVPPIAFLENDTKTQQQQQSSFVTQTLVFTTAEQELFDLIRAVRDKYCPSTTIRVAGGWVRDKLLGLSPTRDVDFVLSDVAGADFAQYVAEYLKTEEECQTKTTTTTMMLECHVKDYGATQSQHLQTANLQYRGLDVDFARLRYERYERHSRVPQTTGMASAVEDAFRRDLTINALFYNLQTNQVEDWTEQGLEDLQAKRIRTPMTALPTLLQDPLRVLRAIRFAAQLGFNMDRTLQRAALDPRVRVGLATKVSPDRRGAEVDALFQNSDHPTQGILLLSQTNLLDTIFPLDEFEFVGHPGVSTARDVYQQGLNTLFRAQAMASLLFDAATMQNWERRRLLWYAAWLDPICRYCSVPSGATQPRRHQQSVVYQSLTQGLKRPVGDSQVVECMIDGADKLDDFMESFADLENTILAGSTTDRADLRWKAYQVLKQIGPHWKESLLLVIARRKVEDITESVQEYQKWVALLTKGLGLDDAVFTKDFAKPILNGSEIQQILPGVQGPRFRAILQSQEEWQVRQACTADNVTESQREHLKDYLLETFPEYANASHV